jgi:hypothetical protein
MKYSIPQVIAPLTYLTMNTTVRNDVRKMMSNFIAKLPVLHTANTVNSLRPAQLSRDGQLSSLTQCACALAPFGMQMQTPDLQTRKNKFYLFIYLFMRILSYAASIYIVQSVYGKSSKYNIKHQNSVKIACR